MWVKIYLSSSLQCSILNDENSNFNEVTPGVPQGSVLGRLLPLILDNDCNGDINSKARLLVDDCVVYTCITDDTSPTRLQTDLN